MDRRSRSASSAVAAERAPPVTTNPVDGFDEVFAVAARALAGADGLEAASTAPTPSIALVGPPTSPSANTLRFIATNARGPKLIAP